MSNNNTPTKRQYYYFYGSTSDTDAVGGDNDDAHHQPHLPSSPAVTDSDSLVGESLIPTDNEMEDDNLTTATGGTTGTSDADFQQLLVSHGNGSGLFTLPENPTTKASRRSSGSSSKKRGNNSNGGGRRAAVVAPWMEAHADFKRKHKALYGLLLVLAIVLAMGIVSVALLPFRKLFNRSGVDSSITSTSNPSTEALQHLKYFKMQFPEIDRASYNDPVDRFIDTTLFDKKLLHPSKRAAGDMKENNANLQKRVFRFPFPTGAFWTNLVLKSTTADRGLSYPIAVYPYAYKWSDSLLQVSYPAIHRKEEDKAIHDYFYPDLTFGIGEVVTSRKITDFGPLSVTLRFNPASSRQSYWETYLVQGSPYITIKYSKVSPVIKALSTFRDVLCPREEPFLADDNDEGGRRRRRRRKLKFGVCASETTSERLDTLQGVQFIIETREGDRWMVFSSELVTLEFDTLTRTTITASVNGRSFTGLLRFAIIPPNPQTTGSSRNNKMTVADQITNSTGVQRLIYHAGVYPVSGNVDFSFRSSASADSSSAKQAVVAGALSKISSVSTTSGKVGRLGTIQFTFTTASFTPTGTASSPESLLMLALPHHAQSLPSNIKLRANRFDLVFRCIKGPMRPILQSSWSYDEPLPTLGFDNDSGSNDDELFLDPMVSSQIIKSLKQDLKLSRPSATENVYGFGKQSARLAQLLHIANKLKGGNATSTSRSSKQKKQPAPVVFDDELSTMLKETQGFLMNLLELFFQGRVSDSLVYDANLGGMVTTDGMINSEADFGNGRYNDHHFHYGYILYACAIIGKLNPQFIKDFGEHVDAIFYDIAFNQNFDSLPYSGVYFPGSRHKVWFDGHSFASGMFPFGNGKSQESSSEAVNCYYGAYLWSLVRNGAASDPSSDTSLQTDFARLLLATEIRGAKTYWHMLPPSVSNITVSDRIYSENFSENFMVGNLGMLDAICSTWFGTESLYVHMINFIPVTSVTGELFSSRYVSQEYSKVLKNIGEVDMAWRGYVVSNHAIVDPNAAWSKALDLFSPTLDSALSKSQVLYWISTRDGFQAPSITDKDPQQASNSSKQEDIAPTAACSTAPACVALGLTGDCCPTSTGAQLNCCSG